MYNPVPDYSSIELKVSLAKERNGRSGELAEPIILSKLIISIGPKPLS
jgi:hypothetical protein